jgi:hypothetical protein
MSLPRCYVASPCGFAASTDLWYGAVLLPLIRRHAVPIDPWPNPRGLNVDQLAERCYWEIQHRAQVMVAVLDQQPPDEGTTDEVAWAAAWGVPVIGYRSDMRSGGEAGERYNVMTRKAIEISGGVEVSTLGEVERALRCFTATWQETRQPDGLVELLLSRLEQLSVALPGAQADVLLARIERDAIALRVLSARRPNPLAAWREVARRARLESLD